MLGKFSLYLYKVIDLMTIIANGKQFICIRIYKGRKGRNKNNPPKIISCIIPEDRHVGYLQERKERYLE